MAQVQQNFQRLSDDAVGSSAIDVGNKTNTAAVFFELRIVQSLFQGQAWVTHLPRTSSLLDHAERVLRKLRYESG
jgi:hypothetical protein